MLSSCIYFRKVRPLFYSQCPSMREKCPCSEFFWSVFSRIQTEDGLSLRILSEYGKIRTRNTPKTDTFHAVHFSVCSKLLVQISHNLTSILLVANKNQKVANKFTLTSFAGFLKLSNTHALWPLILDNVVNNHMIIEIMQFIRGSNRKFARLLIFFKGHQPASLLMSSPTQDFPSNLVKFFQILFSRTIVRGCLKSPYSFIHR